MGNSPDSPPLHSYNSGGGSLPVSRRLQVLIGIWVKPTLPLAWVLLCGALPATAAANDEAMAGPRPLTRQMTTRVVTLGGVVIANLFDGLKPNPAYSPEVLAKHRHPLSRCSAKDDNAGLTWIERLLGVTTVHAQSSGCTGSYWQSSQYQCSTGAGCHGGTLETTVPSPNQYKIGFWCCLYCSSGGSCGEAFPPCFNGET